MSNTEIVRPPEPPPSGRGRVSRIALLIAVFAVFAAGAAAVVIAATSSGASSPSAPRSPHPRTPMNMGQPPAMGGSSSAASGAPQPGGGSAPANPGAGSDPATLLGQKLAGNGQQAISLARTEALSNQLPAGAEVDAQTKTVRFTTRQVSLVVVASPPTGDMKFRTGGINNPTIVVPAHAHITLEFINGDHDMAHMWLLQPDDSGRASVEQHGGADHVIAAPPLGDPGSAGQPAETISFVAPAPGTYHYDCPFPGHGNQGMYGRFIVRST